MIGIHRGCREIEPLLWNYAARTLPEQDIENVEAHLKGCSSCRQQEEAYRITATLTADFRERLVPESETGWTQLRAQIEARQETPLARTLRPRWTLPVWSGAALAAAAVVLLVLRLGTPAKQTRAVDARPSPGMTRAVARSENPLRL
jgi:predicted anti-sigma-YlaC factor YlaD